MSAEREVMMQQVVPLLVQVVEAQQAAASMVEVAAAEVAARWVLAVQELVWDGEATLLNQMISETVLLSS